MDFLDIILIIISSAGLLHGIVFAIYLSFLKKKKTLANYLLALILVFMAFRIGKSVMMNFTENLEPVFIFVGLAFLLLIGPLLKWYVNGMTVVNFKLSPYNALELIPFSLLFCSSFFVTANWFDSNNKQAIIIFGSVLIFIYLHFAFYIFLANRRLSQVKRHKPTDFQSKSHKSILTWLHLLIIGFIVIWISYFLNIIEDAVPYVIGPIMYSIVVYFLSFKAFQLKVTDLDGSVFRENKDIELYKQIKSLVEANKLYLESDISLSSLGGLIGKSGQKTSEVINQYAKHNFNDFINHYRVQESKKLLLAEDNKNYTIATIAFDSGFSSLSSFNGAFKKFEGTTPSVYRKKNAN